jgi:peptidoglycan/xylan/chitin deacetylase (PgdA/CDA1 family)
MSEPPERLVADAVEPAPAGGDRLAAARRRAIKSTAELVDRVRPPSRGIVVLIYHRVGRSSTMQVDLPTAVFAEQMGWLAASGRVTTLDRALDLLAEPDPPADVAPGQDPVVITFDDGTRDLARLAAPILADHGLPALLYVATEFVDRGRSFPDGGAPLTWDELGQLTTTGWELGSHTHTHALLDRLSPDQVDDELDRSIDLLASRVGAQANHFAYPKAVVGHPGAERAVRRRFRSAALAGTRPNRYGLTDPWRLARSPIQISDGRRWFDQKVRGGMGFEDGLRGAANRIRYARDSS